MKLSNIFKDKRRRTRIASLLLERAEAVEHLMWLIEEGLSPVEQNELCVQIVYIDFVIKALEDNGLHRLPFKILCKFNNLMPKL